MPAGMISTGPVDVWLQIPFDNTPQFFGHAEGGVQIRWLFRFKAHKNDLGGTEEPYDKSYQGKGAVISGNFTRLDWNVLQQFSDVTDPTILGNPGTDNPGDIGTLVMTEERAPFLFLRFPRASLFPGTGIVPGVRFWNVLIEDQSWRDLMPGAAVVPMTWSALRHFDPTYISPGGLGWGRWILYDNDLSNLPLVGT